MVLIISLWLLVRITTTQDFVCSIQLIMTGKIEWKMIVL